MLETLAALGPLLLVVSGLIVIHDLHKTRHRIEALEAAVSDSPRAALPSPSEVEKTPQIPASKPRRLVSLEEKVMMDFVKAAKQHGVKLGEPYQVADGGWWVNQGDRCVGALEPGRSTVWAPRKTIEGWRANSNDPVLFKDGELTEEFFKRLL